MKMSIVATRGTHTAIVNLFTTVMAAAISEMSVRVLLRDEAVYRLTRERISEIVLPEMYGNDKPAILSRLKEAGLTDLKSLIRDAKKQGDIRIYACTSSMAILGVSEEDLIEEIDEPRGLTSFLLDEMSESGIVLSF
jgi:peroxiredoxin family protein